MIPEFNIYDHLAEIKATAGNGKFSANLYRWIKKNRRSYPTGIRVFVRTGGRGQLPKRYDPAKTQAPVIYLGDTSWGDTDLSGTRLSSILCNGAKDQTACWAGLANPTCSVEVTTEFWRRYLAEGKCAIDPEHSLFGDRERWNEEDEHRTCRWCCEVQRSVEEIDTVHRKVWVPAAAICMVGPTG